MDLIFVTPVQELLPGAFGAASYGMTGCWDPAAPNTQRFARDVRGTALTGSYADILAQLPASAFSATRAGKTPSCASCTAASPAPWRAARPPSTRSRAGAI